MFMKKILVADDETDILDMLEDIFQMNGYDVIKATGGEEAILHTAQNPDLIILDVNMPDVDGLSVCQTIRNYITCPILFLTAKIEDQDKIRGFQAGADDYILKPFSIDELLIRVEAHLRREERTKGSARIKFVGDLVIDYNERAVYKREEHIPLAKKEFDIIELLSLHAGQIFDKERIYEAIWGYNSEGDSSVIAEHIRRIRVKLTEKGVDNKIETVWGVGYKWTK